MDVLAIAGILLAVIGILLTIGLTGSDAFLIRLLRDRWQRKRWSANLQVERAAIPKLDHYAFEMWHHLIEVDDSGNASHSIDSRILNIGQRLLESVYLPIYCDATDVPETAVLPWARRGLSQQPVCLDSWSQSRARGRLKVGFDPTIPPGKRIRFHWGYKLPKTFKAGDEYYNWDISTPLFELSGELRFSISWSVQYARWHGDLAEGQPAPIVKDRTIVWKVCFPEKGKRVTLEFGLARCKAA